VALNPSKGSDYEDLDLLPADFTYCNLDITFNRQRKREQQLKRVLDPLKKSYDLIILDRPPTISILAENIFNAADHLLVSLIPSNLPIQIHMQLSNYFKEDIYRSEEADIFLSFVDGRKKMHRELETWAWDNFDGVLRNPIAYLSHVEPMGLYRQTVPAFGPASLAFKAH
jgi:chromosome partitioning protein